MGIVVKKQKSFYKSINIQFAQDKKISYKARGILIYLLSKPDNWECRIFDLVSNSDKDGIRSIQSALKELVASGYAKYIKAHREGNKLVGNRYIISDTKILKK